LGIPLRYVDLLQILKPGMDRHKKSGVSRSPLGIAGAPIGRLLCRLVHSVTAEPKTPVPLAAGSL
jgi:hypothetical protein